jgi:hypothetical protein
VVRGGARVGESLVDDVPVEPGAPKTKAASGARRARERRGATAFAAWAFAPLSLLSVACKDSDAPVASGSVEAYAVFPPTKLAALVGPLYRPAPGQESIGFYGTDLGVSFVHHDEIRFLFGDTWADSIATPISKTEDDTQGAISIAGPDGFPDGDSVDAYVAAHPPDAGETPWQNGGPPVVFALGASDQVASIELYRGGSGPPLDMGLGRTVVTAFSNARDGAFAIFRRDATVPCSGGAAPACATGFTCDTQMGYCSDTSGELATPCIVGTTRCDAGATCVVPAAGGLCQDRTSSMYGTGDEDGRLDSLVFHHEVGNADPSFPTRYGTGPWLTNKFRNPIAKTVEDFDPSREDPTQNDYAPASGAAPDTEQVLLWGRPNSVGIQADGKDSRLYFAYVPMPEFSATGQIAWTPHYFSGLAGKKPSFSDDPSEARALDLSGGAVPEFETFDIVDKMTISYVAPLRRWVMFYGGDFPPFVLSVFVGPSFGRVKRDPQGAVHARFATDPWGPWTAPVPVLEAGDPAVNPPLLGSEYALGGILHHPGCVAVGCTPTSPAPGYLLTPEGFLYAPNVVDPWTEARGDGTEADVYWNVSTWNPYETVLLKTRLRP